MTTELITQFVQSRPFTRFEIITVDGRVIPLPHSDFAILERFATAVTIIDNAGRAEMIDTALIVSIRTLDVWTEP